MNTETDFLDAITRRPGERYFIYIKRCKQNEEARISKLAELEGLIKVYVLDLETHWSELCRCAKAYGILIGQWRESEELGNCPFCGGEATLTDYVSNDDKKWFYIVCGDCGTCSDHVSAEEIAVRIWNTRPQEERMKAENERLKAEIAIQKNLTKQICFECNRRDNEINLLKNTIAGFRTGVRFMTENVNFGSRATKSELHKRLSMVFGYLGIMKNALARLEQMEAGEDAPDMDDGRKMETNGTQRERWE